MSVTLKPCAHCGLVPLGVSVRICDDGIFNDVFCPARGCRGGDDVGYEPQGAANAIAAWNRRADGWQNMDTAPRDGTVVLAVCMDAQTPKSGITWWSGEGWMTVWKPEKFVMPGPSKWWPSHWQHLPEAGAS